MEPEGLDRAGGEGSAASPPAPLQAAFHLDLLFAPAHVAWPAVERLPGLSLWLHSGQGWEKNYLNHLQMLWAAGEDQLLVSVDVFRRWFF